MNEIFTSYLHSPVGWLKLTTDKKFLLSISFENEGGNISEISPPVLQQSIVQLEEYFAGIRKDFDIELAPVGTDFQQRIWELVKKVPFGKTASYLDIAKDSGSDKNTRAVGLANGKNPIPIVIPCHRIVGTNGKLTGYAGGLERKRWLLLHEQNFSGSYLLF